MSHTAQISNTPKNLDECKTFAGTRRLIRKRIQPERLLHNA